LEQARQAFLRGEKLWQDKDFIAQLQSTPEAPRTPTSPGLLLFGELHVLDEEDCAELLAPVEARSAPPTGTERKAPPIEKVRKITFSEKEQEVGLPTHTFEKVETADSWRGGNRQTDGDDSLDEQLEALQEVDLSEIMRGGDPARSILKADMQLVSDVADVGTIASTEVGIPYDEWDGKHRRYRPAWCTVYPSRLPAGDELWAQELLLRHRKLLIQLKKRIEHQRSTLNPLKRQLDGEQVDIDALIDALADRQAGREPDPRLYIRQARTRRDFATTVLLDISLSTDGWVDNHRVLDVAREAVLVLGQVADQLGDRVQVLAFASHTRNRCRVWEVRGWHEPWASGRRRLGLLKPQGYTRIGPALRHGTDCLLKSGASRHLLLLISDGKPTDYDAYEGLYGIQDVRQALREAEKRGVITHALAIESVAKDYLPAMFGPGAWDILPRPDRLPEVLAAVYGRLTRQAQS